jgi:hypothetical protein
LPPQRPASILDLRLDAKRLSVTPPLEFVDMMVI